MRVNPLFNQFKSFIMPREQTMLSSAAYLAAHDKDGKLTISIAYYDRYQSINRRLLEFFNGDKPLASIKKEDYKRFHDWLAERDVKPITLKTQRKRLQAIWNRLRERGHIHYGVEDVLVIPHVGNLKPRAVPEDRIKRMVEFCCLRDRAMIMLALRTGVRRQSLPRLTIHNTKIWQTDNKFRFAANLGVEKTSDPRLVFAGHDAALLVYAWIETRQHDSIYIFNNLTNSEPLSLAGVSHVWETALKRANMYSELRGAAWHRLRHMFARSKLSSQKDARLVAEWMGINVETLLGVYANPDVIERAESYFDEKVPYDIMNDLVE